MGAQYDLSSKVNLCNKPPADHSSCHAYTAPVGTPHEVRPSLRQSCNTKLFRIDENYRKLGSNKNHTCNTFCFKTSVLEINIHTEISIQCTFCWGIPGHCNRVPELSPTSGESAEARALQGEHLATGRPHGAATSTAWWMFYDVWICLVMLSPPSCRIYNWKQLKVIPCCHIPQISGVGKQWTWGASKSKVDNGRIMHRICTMWSHLIFYHFFIFFQGHQGQSKLEKDSTQRGIPNSWRSAPKKLSQRSGPILPSQAGTSRTNRKTKPTTVLHTYWWPWAKTVGCVWS